MCFRGKQETGSETPKDSLSARGASKTPGWLTDFKYRHKTIHPKNDKHL
jgi:hypothetical protein